MARIAIVDDSRLARTFAATVVKKLGHEPVDIDPTSIFDVLKALRDAPPDALIMDFLMPNCPGVSLARACHEDAALKDIHLVVVTAHRDDEISNRLERMGVKGFLHKPFEPRALEELLKQIMGE